MENNQIKYGRKRSGIVKELREVINSWLRSITDERVRAIARKNVIVTGGSIASMLMGDKVNDYDMYFRTQEATVAVAEYYIERANEENLRDDEGQFRGVVTVEELPNANDELEQRVLLAFCKSEEYIVKSREDIIADVYFFEDDVDCDGDFRISYVSTNAITLTNKVQLVTRFYGSPEEIHNNYDFAHAMCSYDYANNVLDLKTEALECMLSRTLVYRGSLYPIASVFRTKKFVERGWRISAGEQFKIMWQISKLDLNNPDVLEEQLTGVDMMYLRQLWVALTTEETYKSGSIDTNRVMEIIDEVFGSDEVPEPYGV